jgi:hypothetical protein
MGTDSSLEPKTGAQIVDDALDGIAGKGTPAPETVGRVDAPDSETAEGTDGEADTSPDPE